MRSTLLFRRALRALFAVSIGTVVFAGAADATEISSRSEGCVVVLRLADLPASATDVVVVVSNRETGDVMQRDAFVAPAPGVIVERQYTLGGNHPVRTDVVVNGAQDLSVQRDSDLRCVDAARTGELTKLGQVAHPTPVGVIDAGTGRQPVQVLGIAFERNPAGTPVLAKTGSDLRLAWLAAALIALGVAVTASATAASSKGVRRT